MDQYTGLLSIFGIVVANLGTVIGFYVHLDKKFDESRKETNKMLDEGRKETNEILKGIAYEMKDFHGRLCSLESRYYEENYKKRMES